MKTVKKFKLKYFMLDLAEGGNAGKKKERLNGILDTEKRDDKEARKRRWKVNMGRIIP